VKRRALFVDRDGTLTREIEAVRTPEELELLPGAARALADVRAAGYLAVLVTNQSAIARGWMSEEDLQAVHAHLQQVLARAGTRLDAIYYCPHHPTLGLDAYRRACECRKPRPGMLRAAAIDLDLDLAASFVVGDAERDLAAGAALGVPGILVRTGKGRGEEQRLRASGALAFPCVDDLRAAVEWIVARGAQGR
jgi:D-glycero-D-manno-heptose 1,7-bisphosphate phosphatase